MMGWFITLRMAAKNWTEITPPDLPELALISVIEGSSHDPATVYMAATHYKMDGLYALPLQEH